MKKRKIESHHENGPKIIQNPLLEEQTKFLQSIPQKTRENFFSNLITPDDRAEIWTQQSEFGESMVNEYSWATPDHRAIKIIKHFEPIIEIGCGKNAYWANILKRNGVDIVAYDVDVDQGGMITNESGTKAIASSTKEVNNINDTDDKQNSSITVMEGGPEILLKEDIKNSGRTLMLCYPDEDIEPNLDQSSSSSEPTSLGIQCLENFEGQYIIHIGEVFGHTLSMEQSPWGRSSSPQFQERLAGEYHCLLRASIPSWLHVRDTISVWKRSERCSIIFEAESDPESKVGEDEDEEVEYKHIPVEERLPVDLAAPCVEHLLR